MSIAWPSGSPAPSELITLCRDKITTADLQIRQVTADLDAAADADTAS